MPTAPEQQARETIDTMLAAAGWRRGRRTHSGQSPSSTEATQPSIATAATAQGSKAFAPRSLAGPTRIVAEVEQRLSVVEELEALVTTNLQRATRLRQAVLQKAFNEELG